MFDSEKFQNKYRIKSNRANWWDYCNNGAYFITICTKNRECYFWNYDYDCRDAINCVSTPLSITAMDKIANDIWFEMQKQFNYVELGEFIVMPNHIHRIILNYSTLTFTPSEWLVNSGAYIHCIKFAKSIAICKLHIF